MVSVIVFCALLPRGPNHTHTHPNLCGIRVETAAQISGSHDESNGRVLGEDGLVASVSSGLDVQMQGAVWL